MTQQVQRGALGGKQASHRGADREHGAAGGKPVSILTPHGDHVTVGSEYSVEHGDEYRVPLNQGVPMPAQLPFS